jgi:hypothetical protein
MTIRYIAVILVALSGITASTASAAPQACQIDVRSKPAAPGAKHLFIIYYNYHHEPYYFRGGPKNDVGPSGTIFGSSASSSGGAGPYGAIVVLSGPYTPETKDYVIGAPSVTVLKGPAACPKYACFVREQARINHTGFPYRLATQNSNSVVRTLLEKCELPKKKPLSIAPGWGRIL